MLPQDTRGPARNQRWIECVNVDSVTFEMGDVVEVKDSVRPEKGSTDTPNGGRTVLQVQKVSCDNAANTVIIGHQSIPPNDHGYCTNDFPVFAKLESTAVSVGDELGPVKDQTYLKKNNTGYLVLGDIDSTRVMARVRRYEPGTRLFKFEATTCMEPGNESNTSGKLLYYDDAQADWVDSGETITPKDPEYANFLMPPQSGDTTVSRQFVMRLGATCTSAWEFVGAKGLHQKVKLLADINCGSTGSAEVRFYGVDCIGSGSGCNITICNGDNNTEEGRRNYYNSEIVSVVYRHKRWIAEPQPIVQLGRSTLIGTTCPNDATAGFGATTAVGYCYGPITIGASTGGTADNEYKLSANSGEKTLILIRSEASAGGTGPDYTHAQLEHKCKKVASNTCGQPIFSYGSCQLDVDNVDNASLMTCDVTGGTDTVQLYTHTLVTDVDKTDTTEGSGSGSDPSGDTDECKLRKKTKDFCLFEEAPAETTTTVIEFEEKVVLQDVRVQEKCLQGYIVSVWVPCWEGGEWVDLHCGDVCEASGS